MLQWSMSPFTFTYSNSHISLIQNASTDLLKSDKQTNSK